MFYAFDLLELDGRDLRAAPLHDRRAALEDLLAQVVPRGAVQLFRPWWRATRQRRFARSPRLEAKG